MPKHDLDFDQLAVDVAGAIHAAFTVYMDNFNSITQRSKTRFESRDWHAHQSDALQRLTLYGETVNRKVDEFKRMLGRRAGSLDLWSHVKEAYAKTVAGERNFELAQTFYNSIARRVYGTVGVNHEIEFASGNPTVTELEPDPRIYRRYAGRRDVRVLFRQILDDYRFDVDYRSIENDAEEVALRVESRLNALFGTRRIDSIEILRPVFYRNKAAYLMGRVLNNGHAMPLILALLNSHEGVIVDAVLMRESEVSILFSFTRSYFHVEAECPRDLISFLRTIIPVKPVEDLYAALGCNKHSKTELYRSLRQHLNASSDLFELTGDRGMVMVVFALSSYDRVFKIIRDRFAPPKNMTPREVQDRYRLVFERDRVGRLVEAQVFRRLKIRVDRFSKELSDELMEDAARTVTREGEFLIIDRLYMERKVRPLNLYLREADDEVARRIVLEYGDAIKELAAANIFPGDFLLKNFGVTRHGRVVFYDYDELCLLTDCNFRTLPPPRTDEEALAPEPWFAVGENDIFPEEFGKFLGLPEPLLEVFQRYHGDLLTARFWRDLQRLHQEGAILNFFPYPQSERVQVEEPA